MASDRRNLVDTKKPHYWKEHGKYKVRDGAWVYCGLTLDLCHKSYLYWSMQTNEKPS